MPKETGKYTLEQLMKLCNVPLAIHVGVCAQKGWHTGKELVKTEYAAAVERFKAGAGRGKNA